MASRGTARGNTVATSLWFLAIRRRAAFAALIVALVLWLSYVLWSTKPFQDCLGDQGEGYKTAKKAPEDPPEGRLSLLVNARNDTVCTFHVLYEYRDAVTALATVFIAAFTLTLWLSTKRLSKEAETASGIADKSADAALRSATVAESALTNLERPYVFRWTTGHPFTTPGYTQHPGAGYYDVACDFVNRGRTPALVKEIKITFQVTEVGEFPILIDPNKLRGFGVPPTRVISGNAERFNELVPYEVNSRLQGILEGKLWVYLLGFMRYEDVFGGRHILGFCSRYHPHRGDFVLEGDLRYNYTKDEGKEAAI